jgi:GWxTD domain-containing protein
VVTNFEQVTSVLRYFERQDWVARLRDAPPLDRPQVWRDFWKQTDPVPITPENEALTEYFARVQVANERFKEEGEAGWLTDRGEVYVTLGEADEAVELNPDQTGGQRLIRWVYNEHRLTLFYQDQGGFGRYRLTQASRADYQRVLARIRRSQ